MRAILNPAFILHTRPLNETSVLLDVFTQSHGRINLIAKGVRTGRSSLRGLLRPFVPLLINWSGKTELMALSKAELAGASFNLASHALFSGLYLNELLVRALPRFDPYPAVFDAYQNVLGALQHIAQPESNLRRFEKVLLAELGYGFALDKESVSGENIKPGRFYEFKPGLGLIECKPGEEVEMIFSGKCLLAFHAGKLEGVDDLRAAKQLNRMAIASLLGNKRLKSRDFFTCNNYPAT